MSTCDVTLVTEQRFPDLTADDRLFRDALERRGLSVRAAVWNDPAVDWSASAVTAIRSTWDYFHHFDAFCSWLDRVEGRTQVINTIPVLRWNAHKKYLEDLRLRGVEVVPTVFAKRAVPFDLAATCSDEGWRNIVVKPCVSGSSFGARRFDVLREAKLAQDHTTALLRERDVMVQPYMDSVETERERSLIYFNGEFSHAIRKAAFTTLATDLPLVRYDATDREIAFGRDALDRCDALPAYARVDLVPTPSGPMLMELELIEPGLFFGVHPESANRFAEIIADLRNDR